ncbi:MAG TPA: acyl-CoA dehydratase activase [Candidatus Bathyarchaeia archaeon]|nr:acyl-CoA dehydratase activase [Candidatus Bathyarchaeia archaeon]
MVFAGIDAGSRAVKVVLIESGQRRVLSRKMCDQGVEQEALAADLLDQALHEAGHTRADLGRIIATGYGRNRIVFADSTVTEITCHAKGVRRLDADAMTIVEIGGQDSKLIRLDGSGLVRDFVMNDRCAAGTGRFLEVVAARLGTGLEDLGRMARKSLSPAPISSMCVVFAETEIVGLLATGAAAGDIVAGVQASIAKRVVAMAGRNVDEPIYFTGGVALVTGMAEAVADALGRPVKVAQDPQYTGALGAALIAAGEPGGGLQA